jgi:hypothetical protein
MTIEERFGRLTSAELVELAEFCLTLAKIKVARRPRCSR